MTGFRPLFPTLSILAVAGTLIAAAPSAQAAAILFNNFSNLSGMQLNVDARANHACGVSGDGATCSAVTDDLGRNVLRLTDQLSTAGSAFSTSLVSLDLNASFSTAFQFRISNPLGAFDTDGVQGADGIVFVLQTVANTAGGGGGGIGYAGLSPSIGIEIDTWNNGTGDANSGNHIGINVNGSTSSSPLATVATSLNNGADWWMWVDYDGVNDLMEVRLSQNSTRPAAAQLSTSIDLVATFGQTDVYAGFTSGTGISGGYHDIVSWQLNSTFDPIDDIGDPGAVPEPASLGLFGLALGLLAVVRRRRG